MLRSALVALAVAAGSLPALAGAVDPEIHKLCVEAKDYGGCVKAMKGESSEPSSVRVIDAGPEKVPNSCPTGYAYTGSGYCTRVGCLGASRNHPELAGKNWSCKRRSWAIGQLSLVYKSGDTIPAKYDSMCPNVEPGRGYRNSCESQWGWSN